MINFKHNNATSNLSSNREINLKIHEMLLNYYKSRNMRDITDVYESVKNGFYNKLFTYIKSTIDN